MNKKLKLLTTSLLLCGSLLSAVPAHADVTDVQENTAVEAVEVENTADEAGKINSRSGECMVVTANNVALRKKASLSSTVLERLNKGDKVYYVSMGSLPYADGHYWDYVGYRTSGGMIYGYIADEYVSF